MLARNDDGQTLSHPPPPTQLSSALSVLKHPRKLPSNLACLKSKSLADFIYQYISQSLDKIPMEPNNSAQNDANRAIAIVYKFYPNIKLVRNLPNNRTPTKDDSASWRSIANRIQDAVLKHIAQQK